MQYLPWLRKRCQIVLHDIFLSRIKFLEKLAARHKWLNKIHLNLYQAIIKKEIELAKINERTKILHVGGGLPYTAMVIARLTGADVVIFEIEPEIRDMACEWIRENGLQEKIKVVLADGADTPASGFGVIIVSLGVEPKEAVISNVYNTCDLGAKIIYRSARKSFEAIYRDKVILTRYGQYIKETVYHNGFFLKASHLLIEDSTYKKGFRSSKVQRFRTENPEPRTQNSEPRTENPEPRTENPEQ